VRTAFPTLPGLGLEQHTSRGYSRCDFVREPRVQNDPNASSDTKAKTKAQSEIGADRPEGANRSEFDLVHHIVYLEKSSEGCAFPAHLFSIVNPWLIMIT
jgi:hypothetical protein